MKNKMIILIKNLPSNIKKKDFDFLWSLVEFKVKFNKIKNLCFISFEKDKKKLTLIKKKIINQFPNKVIINVFNKIPLELNEPSKIILIIFEKLNNFNIDVNFVTKIIQKIDYPLKWIFFYKNNSYQALVEFDDIDRTKSFKKKLPAELEIYKIVVNIYYTKKKALTVQKNNPNEIEFSPSTIDLKKYSKKNIHELKTSNNIESFKELNPNKLFKNNQLFKIIYLEFNKKFNFKDVVNYFNRLNEIDIIRINNNNNKAVIYFKNDVDSEIFLQNNNENCKIKIPIVNYDFIHIYFLLYDDIDEYYTKIMQNKIYNVDNNLIFKEMELKINNYENFLETINFNENKDSELNILKSKKKKLNNVLILSNYEKNNFVKLFNFIKKSININGQFIDYFKKLNNNDYLMIFNNLEITELIISKWNNKMFDNSKLIFFKPDNMLLRFIKNKLKLNIIEKYFTNKRFNENFSTRTFEIRI